MMKQDRMQQLLWWEFFPFLDNKMRECDTQGAWAGWKLLK